MTRRRLVGPAIGRGRRSRSGPRSSSRVPRLPERGNAVPTRASRKVR